MIFFDLRDIADRDRRAIFGLDRRSGEVSRRDDGKHVLDADQLGAGVDCPAGADDGRSRELEQAMIHRVGSGLHDRAERDLMRLHAFRIDLHGEVLQPLAPDRHVGHARNAQQARPDGPVSHHRHRDQGVVLRRHAYLHDPARRRHWGEHDGGRRPGRQQRLDRREAFLYELPRLPLVRALVEDQLDRRQLRHRLRPHVLQTLDSVQGLLERNRDERLHVSRR